MKPPSVIAAGPGPLRPNWFVAFPLPPPARWAEAATTAPAALRRLDPADLHLTLAFLGACGEARALAAWEALATRRGPPITIAAGAWRALGPPQRPSAYGCTLAEGHRELVERLRDWAPLALQAAGCGPERRDPLPHVTLLRPRRRDAPMWRQPMERWMAAAPLPPHPARLTALALYTWATERSERLFRLVCERSLP